MRCRRWGKPLCCHDDPDDGLVPWFDFHITGPQRGAAAMFFFLYCALTGLHALVAVVHAPS
jgi:hypothetical protein